jgi:anti-sigma regulatory factor (Ser/Thr protein kinase)
MAAYQLKGTCMDEYTSRIRVWGLTCPGSKQEIGRARRWIRDVLHDCPRVEDAVLIVSELGTNAITHTASGETGGSFDVAVARSDSAIVIVVCDQGRSSAEPCVRQASEGATNGRGLATVAALATDIRVRGDEHGRRVIAELDMGQPSSAHPTAIPAQRPVLDYQEVEVR